jgi:hypothetical protein
MLPSPSRFSLSLFSSFRSGDRVAVYNICSILVIPQILPVSPPNRMLNLLLKFLWNFHLYLEPVFTVFCRMHVCTHTVWTKGREQDSITCLVPDFLINRNVWKQVRRKCYLIAGQCRSVSMLTGLRCIRPRVWFSADAHVVFFFSVQTVSRTQTASPPAGVGVKWSKFR